MAKQKKEKRLNLDKLLGLQLVSPRIKCGTFGCKDWTSFINTNVKGGYNSWRFSEYSLEV